MVYAAAMVTTGFQAALFAVYANKYAVSTQLIPDDPVMGRFAKMLKLEAGLAIGLVLLMLGFAGALFSLYRWWQAGLGDLNPSETMRTVIGSALLLAFGSQICFSSFFLSILDLKRRPSPEEHRTNSA